MERFYLSRISYGMFGVEEVHFPNFLGTVFINSIERRDEVRDCKRGGN